MQIASQSLVNRKERLNNVKSNREEKTQSGIRYQKVALSCGYKHIKAEQVAGIAESFCNRHPNYKAVRILKHANDCASLFVSLHFIDKELEFED